MLSPEGFLPHGQLAGAFYGASGIPPAWVEKLALRETIVELADALWDHGQPVTTNRS